MKANLGVTSRLNERINGLGRICVQLLVCECPPRCLNMQSRSFSRNKLRCQLVPTYRNIASSEEYLAPKRVITKGIPIFEDYNENEMIIFILKTDTSELRSD